MLSERHSKKSYFKESCSKERERPRDRILLRLLLRYTEEIIAVAAVSAVATVATVATAAVKGLWLATVHWPSLGAKGFPLGRNLPHFVEAPAVQPWIRSPC